MKVNHIMHETQNHMTPTKKKTAANYRQFLVPGAVPDTLKGVHKGVQYVPVNRNAIQELIELIFKFKKRG